MKSILISIKPEWVAKILNGEKTIEIRKNAPKCDLPIDVYVYCTEPHAKEVLSLFVAEVRQYYGGRVVEFIERKRVDNPGMRWSICNGKVVAKFTLSAVTRMCLEQPYLDYYAKKACVSVDDVIDYQMHPIASKLYAWHISDLQIFDKPKELSEFKHPYFICRKYCDNNFIPSFCKDHCSHNTDPERLDVWCDRNDKWRQPITKAPQSWCYVEVSK